MPKPMPQFQTYGDDTPTSNDKFLFYKGASNVLKTVTLTNLATAIRTIISSYFTSSTVMPSAAPAAGRIPIGNAGGTAYAATALSGDATVSSAGVVTIAANAVTRAKQEPVQASKLLGRGSSSGTGSPEEITLGTGLSMSGTTLNVSAGTGNVSQASNASEANHLFVSGAADKSRVETPVTVDPSTGDMDGIGDMAVESVETPEITIDSAHPSDDTYHGITLTGLNAGATIAQWEAVYIASDGDLELADAAGSGTMGARGLAVAAANSTDPCKILILGTVRNDAWAWTPGSDIYISTTAGGLTQTPPGSGGDDVQRVGFALTSDKAFFNFGAGDFTTV